MSSLSPEKVRAFRELGYFNAGRVFDDAELEQIRSEYDRVLAKPVRLGEKGRGPFDYSPLLHMQSEVLCRYAASPKLARIAVDLIGPDVRLWWDQAIAKGPGATSEVPWHQDNGYTPVVPEEYVTFTVSIDEHTKDNGCLWIQPGSHRHGIRPHRRSDGVFYRGYEGSESGVPVETRRGEVLVFSSLTLHRTGPNTSSGWRRSWIVQLFHADSHHRDTGVRFDDRLLVAKDGVPLERPYRDRPFDVHAALQDALRGGAEAGGEAT